MPGVGCVTHIQTHKHTVPAPGFALLCASARNVCVIYATATLSVWETCICTERLCVLLWQIKKNLKKKARPCQYGTFPDCLVVNCWGLVFDKQPNKRTLPVGQ